MIFKLAIAILYNLEHNPMDKLSEYKKLNAPSSTITRNVMDLSTQTGNIYETAVLIAQRADQIAHELKQELSEKLQAFAFYTDSPEREVFENDEQIELSKSYENMPKAALLATQEYVEHRLGFAEKPETTNPDGISPLE